jgi:hypothetical protein
MKTLIAHLQKYYGVYLLIMAVLFMFFWFQNRAVNRYAISGSWESGAIILDTRTGQAWLRLPRAVCDLGTIDKPKYDKMTRILGGGLSGTSTSSIEEMTDSKQ